MYAPEPFAAMPWYRARPAAICSRNGSGVAKDPANAEASPFASRSAYWATTSVGVATKADSLTGTGALPVSGGALPAGAVLRNNLSFTYTDVVAFHVPPADVGGPIRVLGAEHTYTSASGS